VPRELLPHEFGPTVPVRLRVATRIDRHPASGHLQSVPRHSTAVARRASWLALAATLAALLAWQLTLFKADLPQTYMLRASGLHAQQKFVYFLYYLNLFPVASLESGRDLEFFFSDRPVVDEPDKLDYSPEGARALLADRGDSLVMEWGHSLRNGGLLGTYLYLLDAWRLGSPRDAEMRVATTVAFLAGLAAVLTACWLSGARALGIGLVLLLGSNPFQLFEAYRRENVFGWPIALFCVVLALMIPILAGRSRSRYQWAAVILSGVAVGTVFHIRPENGSMLVTVVIACLVAPALRPTRRMALIATAVVAFVATWGAWSQYFDRKWEEATEVVTRAGGHSYTWQRGPTHEVWWTLWAGLGDFDTKYGYSYADDVGIAWSQPILQARYGEPLPWWFNGVKGKTERSADDYFDADRIYYRHPMQSAHFMDVMREKVIHDVTHDPLWYASILLKRTWRVLTETTPVQLLVSDEWRIPFPFAGLLAIPIALLAAYRKDRMALGLILCSLPLSLTALAVYSGNRMTNYSVYHIVAAAVVIAWVVEAVAVRRVVRPVAYTVARPDAVGII
jgi:hypothetical protein